NAPGICDLLERTSLPKRSIFMGLPVVLAGLVGTDMPATFSAWWRLGIAGLAIKRTAVEELLKSGAVVHGEVARIGGRDGFLGAAPVAMSVVKLHKERREVVVQPLGQEARAVAQRTGHVQLGDDCFADEGAFVRQFVEDVGQFTFDFEGNDGGLGIFA